MHLRNGWLGGALTVGVLVMLLGCLCWPGEDPEVAAKRWHEFHVDQLHRTYRMFREARERLGRPPESVEELVPLAQSEEDEGTLRYIRGGNILVQWGADPIRDCPQGPGQTLFIHDIKFRKQGDTYLRNVLFADGSLRIVTNEELAKLPRPQK